MHKFGRVFVKGILWLLTLFLALLALVYMPSPSSFLALAAVLILLPVQRWQNVLNRFIPRKIKTLSSVVLVVCLFALLPNTQTPDLTTDSLSPEPTVIATQEAPTETTSPMVESTEASTAKPTAAPTAKPTAAPTAKPTAAPTAKPTAAPTAKPTAAPTAKPTAAPTAKPTAAPTAKPTAAPTAKPTAAPTAKPTAAPTAKPTAAPTAKPTAAPTAKPTAAPTASPTSAPTPEATKDARHNYVLNNNTMKFHYPSCSSVQDIKDTNRQDYYGTREELIQKNYSPCGRCKP